MSVYLLQMNWFKLSAMELDDNFGLFSIENILISRSIQSVTNPNLNFISSFFFHLFMFDLSVSIYLYIFT